MLSRTRTKSGRARRVMLQPHARIMGAYVLLILIVAFLSGCSEVPTGQKSTNDVAAENALNIWWKEFNQCIHCPPVKAGTVTPAHTIRTRDRVYNVPLHVQTKQEEADEAEDVRFVEHKRAIVQGFSVKGKTVTVITKLASEPVDIADAEELCHNLGFFVFPNSSRFGLENIMVIGRDGSPLAGREGLRGKVHGY